MDKFGWATILIFTILILQTNVIIAQQPYIKIIEPVVDKLKDGDTIYIGTIGPGQTIPILFEAVTEKGGKFGKGGRWDHIKIKNTPNGWQGFESKLYENPLQINIKADPIADEGNYTVRVIVVDENNADLMGNMTLTLLFTVSHDVYDYTINPNIANVGTYQPARFKIHIYNKGNAPDMFTISTDGLTSWLFRKTVYIPARDDKEVIYEVVGTEEETYSIKINVESESSPLLHDSRNITVRVRSNLGSDYKSVVNGMLIFPVAESTLYAFIGLISNII